MKPVIPVVLLGILIPACRDEGPTVAGDEPQLVTAPSPVTQVIGGGTFVRADLEGMPRGAYSFRAQVDGSGTASGMAEIHFATIDVQVHIDIRCLAIQRSEAWLSGPVAGSNDPAMPVGRVLLWKVQDNGDGGAVFPDRISAFAYNSTDNYAPDVCRWKPAMDTRPWENGNVRILSPGSLGLWDMVGTWDVTKYICVNLANPADTQSLVGSGMRMRQTVAPNGRYTMVWWRPGNPSRIIENTRGWIDVVNGLVRVTGGEGPMIIEYPGYRIGNVSFMEFDANVCHWDDDDEEDPSHVVGEMRLKRTGMLIDDLAGTWDATVWRYTSVADPGTTVDQVAEGVIVTLILGLDSHFILRFQVGQAFMEDSGEMLFEGNELLSRSDGGQDTGSGTFRLVHGVWSFSGAAEYDFDGDPATPREPATLQAVLVRR